MGERLGLALSGGGFRATLFHLGVVRYLRDVDRLRDVTHICSVSGGSVLAAHLVLHWEQYNSANDEDFEIAAREILRFVKLDVRNRILRRVPLCVPLHVVGGPWRLGSRLKLTRTGFLERYYARYLFGNMRMADLRCDRRDRPRLHILTTNVSSGNLCSFTPWGFTKDIDIAAPARRPQTIFGGACPIALAVTASSAFPAFFPPAEVRRKDLATPDGTLVEEFCTDGGVFDNLGVRKFKQIQDCCLGDATLHRIDVPDPLALAAAIRRLAEDVPEFVPLAERLDEIPADPVPEEWERWGDRVLKIINGWLSTQEVVDPEETASRLDDEGARYLLETVHRQTHRLDRDELVWINRLVLERRLAVRKAEEPAVADGSTELRPPLIKHFNGKFDRIIVSDAGRAFQYQNQMRYLWLFGTAVRAADVLFNRVGQLESERFRDADEFQVIRLSDRVDPEGAPGALPLDVQAQLPEIRTDFDRFNEFESSNLVQHGYAVAADRLQWPASGERRLAAWDPYPARWKGFQGWWVTTRSRLLNYLWGGRSTRRKLRGRDDRSWSANLRRQIDVELMQSGAERRLLSSLLTSWDIVAPVWICLLCILGFGTLTVLDRLAESRQLDRVQAGLQILQHIHRTLDLRTPSIPSEPVPVEEIAIPDWDALPVEWVSDERVVNLRHMNDQPQEGQRYSCPTIWTRSLRLRRTGQDAFEFPIQWRTRAKHVDVFLVRASWNTTVSNTEAHPVRHATNGESAGSNGVGAWEYIVDVPAGRIGEPVEFEVAAVLWGAFTDEWEDWPAIRIDHPVDHALLAVVLPQGRAAERYWLYKSPTDRSKSEEEHSWAAVVSDDREVLCWPVRRPKVDHSYEIQWKWSDPQQPALPGDRPTMEARVNAGVDSASAPAIQGP